MVELAALLRWRGTNTVVFLTLTMTAQIEKPCMGNIPNEIFSMEPNEVLFTSLNFTSPINVANIQGQDVQEQKFRDAT
jgi:hypothetical protein